MEKAQEKWKNVSQVVARTAECLGVSQRTVVNVTAKVKHGEPFLEVETRNCDMEVPEAMIPVVRSVIMSLYRDKVHITLDLLLSKLKERRNANKDLEWKWERTTLHKFLTTKMSYCYRKKESYHDRLKEKVVIADQRIKYIKKIQEDEIDIDF